MPVVAHPGPTSPAAPSVRLETPDSWSAPPAGDALLCATGPGSAGDPITVEVRHVTAPSEVDVAALVEQWAGRAAAGAGEVEDPFVVEIGGREWAARNVTWSHEGVPVVEVHLATSLTGADDAIGRHVLAVGRVRGAGLEQDYDTLQGVLETLTVDGDRA